MVKNSLQSSFFLCTWVHLYKDGSVYIKYEPLSVIPPNMIIIACFVVLQHNDNTFWTLLIKAKLVRNLNCKKTVWGHFNKTKQLNDVQVFLFAQRHTAY